MTNEPQQRLMRQQLEIDALNDHVRRSEFDLEHRTALYGEAVINFCSKLYRSAVTKPLISQLVRSACSIGANYCEADESATRREFRYRISLCRRESRETKHWLRMLAAALPAEKERGRSLWKEADELTRIFAAIHRNTE
ncbi:MAG: four helix bundle protein [Planctomycetaceae bacterium]|nr:four helix bundle protein [Planctomycetaceae bacterium]